MIVGIDLGTTNSAIGYLTDDGPRLIPNSLGKVLTPSVVGIDRDGSLLVGESAKELQVVAPERCASVFKRQMGTDWRCRLEGKEFTATELSSLVLRSLAEDAVQHFGNKITDAVITVPAYFNELQRRATILAGQMAGLKVERIINEPTAAAIAYGLPDRGAEKLVAVLDLGGGTFDVSVVDFFEGVVEVRASSGECFLGGEDFTSMLVKRVLEQHGHVYEQAEFKEPLLVSRTRQICERAKIDLSKRGKVLVRVADNKGELSEHTTSVTFTREQFREWAEPLLAQMDLPIRRALGDANLAARDMDEIILVGGATRMPTLIERVSLRFGKEPRCSINPDEVVALGAAVQAGLIEKNAAVDDLVVTDVAPFTLGFDVSKEFGVERRSGYFLPMINRNTPIPASRVKEVGTVSCNQTQIAVEVYQGESRRVEQNILLGTLNVDGIPPGPPGAPVEVRFTYDVNGVLEVETTVVETQEKKTLVLSQHAEHLSETEIAAAVEAMQAIKVHPRDQSENRLLLRRAERVFTELPLVERHQLEKLLTGFEECLEMGDEAGIGKIRCALESFLDQMEGIDGE
ncbi:Hsp70 family protein [Roseiconus nitratireducens]|uniref:Hsp70 family protein n=1 Tax=Roseiconus nitratireducens TaxID=2605748 RepID=UPI00191C1AC2|nr:Hsp70 family protein [Roseiconus nitratireducens]